MLPQTEGVLTWNMRVMAFRYLRWRLVLPIDLECGLLINWLIKLYRFEKPSVTFIGCFAQFSIRDLFSFLVQKVDYVLVFVGLDIGIDTCSNENFNPTSVILK